MSTIEFTRRLAATAVAPPGPCPVIETKRLVLRPQRLSDAGSIAESLGDFAVTRMLARVPAPYHKQDALEWLVLRTSGTLPDWDFAITSGDDTLIGVVSVELRHGEWHLGYWLNRFYWGKGYMTEAVAAVVERFFRRMPGVVLHSGVFADNPASLRVQEKLGFRVTGCHQIYATARAAMVAHIDTTITAEDFIPPHRT
ncbi:GNAT family N-acetyltransferase [Agrobacterium leguminum]|uniref:GNAT family N-acetyltransferase n=1 Tax=Agrobacterium leguminum TaxID=2792015 RepID=UPI0030CB3367